MLKVTTNFTGLDKLNKHISFVEKLVKMKTDKDFQRFIQNKCMKTLEQIMNERLIGGTTNDEDISLYRESNHLVETSEGFIIYNDAKIPAQSKYVEEYPNGQFSIALAFEYGVGIVGSNTGNPNAWQYNVHNYNFGWYPPNSAGQRTSGYIGFEIYRYTADAINKNLKSWINEYYRKV